MEDTETKEWICDNCKSKLDKLENYNVSKTDNIITESVIFTNENSPHIWVKCTVEYVHFKDEPFVRCLCYNCIKELKNGNQKF